MVTLFYIKKEEDSLYFWYFQKNVYSDAGRIGVLPTKLRKLKKRNWFTDAVRSGILDNRFVCVKTQGMRDLYSVGGKIHGSGDDQKASDNIA